MTIQNISNIKSILKKFHKTFSNKPISFYSIYAKMTNSIEAGLLLSQLLYWYDIMNDTEFWKTDDDLCKELSISLCKLKSAKEKLSKLNLVIIKRKGIPAKTHYNINVDNIINAIVNYKEVKIDKIIGFVYFLKAENNLIKIGKAINIENRINQISPKIPLKTEIIYVIKTSDYSNAEINFHEFYKDKRFAETEWFNLTDKDIQNIINKKLPQDILDLIIDE